MFVNQGGPLLKCPAAMKQSRAYRFAGNDDSFLARHPGARDPLHAVGPLPQGAPAASERTSELVGLGAPTWAGCDQGGSDFAD